LKKASKLHSGYNLCPISNALEQPEEVWVSRREKERKKISFDKGKCIDLLILFLDWMSTILCWFYSFTEDKIVFFYEYSNVKTIRS
jgi:hypothetical protein